MNRSGPTGVRPPKATTTPLSIRAARESRRAAYSAAGMVWAASMPAGRARKDRRPEETHAQPGSREWTDGGSCPDYGPGRPRLQRILQDAVASIGILSVLREPLVERLQLGLSDRLNSTLLAPRK